MFPRVSDAKFTFLCISIVTTRYSIAQARIDDIVIAAGHQGNKPVGRLLLKSTSFFIRHIKTNMHRLKNWRATNSK